MPDCKPRVTWIRAVGTTARSTARWHGATLAVSGEIVYSDGSREPIDAGRLIEAPESALSILWLAVFAGALAVLLARWL